MEQADANACTDRRWGSEGFVTLSAKVLGPRLAPQKVGRKPKAASKSALAVLAEGS